MFWMSTILSFFVFINDIYHQIFDNLWYLVLILILTLILILILILNLNEDLNVIILNLYFEQVIYDYWMIYRVKINDNIIKIFKWFFHHFSWFNEDIFTFCNNLKQVNVIYCIWSLIDKNIFLLNKFDYLRNQN
jgi:hypothetical protein